MLDVDTDWFVNAVKELLEGWRICFHCYLPWRSELPLLLWRLGFSRASVEVEKMSRPHQTGHSWIHLTSCWFNYTMMDACQTSFHHKMNTYQPLFRIKRWTWWSRNRGMYLTRSVANNSYHALIFFHIDIDWHGCLPGISKPAWNRDGCFQHLILTWLGDNSARSALVLCCLTSFWVSTYGDIRGFVVQPWHGELRMRGLW